MHASVCPLSAAWGRLLPRFPYTGTTVFPRSVRNLGRSGVSPYVTPYTFVAHTFGFLPFPLEPARRCTHSELIVLNVHCCPYNKSHRVWQYLTAGAKESDQRTPCQSCQRGLHFSLVHGRVDGLFYPEPLAGPCDPCQERTPSSGRMEPSGIRRVTVQARETASTYVKRTP